jgi:hypothetical protein
MPIEREVNVVEIDVVALHTFAALYFDGLGIGGCSLDVDESSVGYGHSTILQTQTSAHIKFHTLSLGMYLMQWSMW